MAAEHNRSRSVSTLFKRTPLSNQTVWLVWIGIFGLPGPICARALKSPHLLELRPRGHRDWPVNQARQTVQQVRAGRAGCLSPGWQSRVPYGSLPIGAPIGPEHTTTSFGIGTCKAIGWLVSNSEQE